MSYDSATTLSICTWIDFAKGFNRVNVKIAYLHLMLLVTEEDLIIVFSLCLSEYFVPTNSVLPSSPLISLSLNRNLSPRKTPLFIDVALLDTLEELEKLQWLLRLIYLLPDSTL